MRAIRHKQPHVARMMSILPALVALCQCRCLLAYVHSTTNAQQINTDKEDSNTVNKSLEFVNIIRDDLRRNNDDYKLLEGENQLADTTPLAHPTKSSHPVHPAHPVHPVHTAYSVLPGYPTPRQPYRNILSPVPRLQPAHPPPTRSNRPPPPPTRPARPPPLPARPARPPPLPARPARPPHPHARPAHSFARASPLRRFDTRKGEANLNQPTAINPNQFRSYTRSKHYKILRLNKLKQLLNKDNFNMRQTDLVEDEPQAEGQPEAEDTTIASPPATKPTTQSSPPPTTPEHKPPPSPFIHAPTTQPQPFLPLQEMRDQGSMMRNRKEDSLKPEQLDMAPARNPELTRIRIKGRLCQRSLMNAEGPTYSALGKLLKPAYRPKSARGRKFHQTRAPGLVLPRCCNCCKKSVLGCQ